MTLVPGDYLWCQHSVQYFLACYEEKNEKATLNKLGAQVLPGNGITGR